MFDIQESMPNVLRDLLSAPCSHSPAGVDEWVLVARRADGELRVYGSGDDHTPGLLADAATEVRAADQ